MLRADPESVGTPTGNGPPSRSRPPKLYLTVRSKFLIANSLAVAWFVVSLVLSAPWADDLAAVIGPYAAWFVITFIALVPGYLNAFLVLSLLLDQPPELRRAVHSPPVSVLIAAFNEETFIRETLRSVGAQTYDGEVEVLVVDDGSTDRTCEFVRECGMPNVRLVAAEHGGKSSALNAGLAEVSHEYLVTIDADTFLHPQALERIMARVQQDPSHTAAVAGCVLAKNSRDSFMSRAQEWDYFLAIASVKRQQALYQGTLVAQGAFSVYRTDVVRKIAGWPSCIGEDIVLTWALIKSGHRIGYEPTAIGFTNVPLSVGGFARQRRRWARGMIEGFKAHGDMLAKRLGLVNVLVALDLLFPLLDGVYTLVFLPGVLLAFTGRFWIAGPMTVAVLPLTLLVAYVMYRNQRRVFAELGLRVRRNQFAYVAYLLGYQALMSPVCVWGYAEELAGVARRW